ncbi:MAG: hypothetical protein GY940_17250 [bacterium]|nr:hypothetical protein [bacterium]
MANQKNFYQIFLEYTRNLFTILSRLVRFKENMAAQGFDADRITDGIQARTKAEDIHLNLMDKFNERSAKKKTVTSIFTLAWFYYAGFVKRLRPELFDDPATYAELGLTGIRKTTISGFIEQATLFYNAAMNKETVAAKLLALKITKEMLQPGYDSLKEFKEARSKYEEVKGECQSLGVDRRKAFRVLKFWVSAFKEAALMAYAENTQELEKLNIFVRNSPIRKKKAAIDSTETTEPPALPESKEPVTITQVIDTTEPPALAETAE